MTVREAERDAARLLDESWAEDDGIVLPVDPFEIASSMGIECRFEALPSDQSGYIEIPPGDGQVVIHLNRWDSRSRQRFTCAHEIAHYLRRRSQAGRRTKGKTIYDYRSDLAGMGTDPDEIYANQFAAALLMPGRFVVEDAQAGQSVDEMAVTYGTSTQAMGVRLRNLRLR